MKIKLLWIGRAKDQSYSALVDQYRKRLNHYCAVEIVELKENKTGKAPPQEVMKREGNAIMKALVDADFVVLLDERGEQRSSIELSRTFQSKMNAAVPRMVFVVGGPWGVDPAVTQRANMIWSLSKLTLPHDMARLVLIEQIYRAFTILQGENYHNP